MACAICTHKRREEIEQALLSRNLADSVASTESIAEEFGVKFMDLQVHAMTHPFLKNKISEKLAEGLPGGSEVGTKPATFVEAIEYREAMHLREVISDNLATMQAVGAKIREAAKLHTSDNPSLYKIPKTVVDLYTASSDIVNTAVLNLAKVNSMIGNDVDPGTQALGQLAMAIKNSVPATTQMQIASSPAAILEDEEDE